MKTQNDELTIIDIVNEAKTITLKGSLDILIYALAAAYLLEILYFSRIAAQILAFLGTIIVLHGQIQKKKRKNQ